MHNRRNGSMVETQGFQGQNDPVHLVYPACDKRPHQIISGIRNKEQQQLVLNLEGDNTRSTLEK